MAKVGQGKAQQSKGKAGTSTDEICKGSALFRNDTKRHGNDMLATEKHGNVSYAKARQSKSEFGDDKY